MDELVNFYVHLLIESRIAENKDGIELGPVVTSTEGQVVDIPVVEMTRPYCDFKSLNFTHELFNFVLNLTKAKIEAVVADSDRPAPQIGPLVMDVMDQRQVILSSVLNIDFKVSLCYLLDFERHQSSSNQAI